MKLHFKVILGSTIALMLGIAATSPILVPNLALTTKIKLDVDVVYAYFGVQEFNSQITGLWRNSSNIYECDLHFVSYFIVLNITDLSDKPAIIEEFEASAAQEILVCNGTSKVGSERLRENMSVSLSKFGFSIAMENRIVTDFRDVSRYYPGWSQYLSPKTSRLIAITGIVEVSNTAAYDALQSGTIYLFGRVKGRPLGEGTSSTAFCLKYVQLQGIGKDRLYNAVISENQIWRMDTNGLDVYIETRR